MSRACSRLAVVAVAVSLLTGCTGGLDAQRANGGYVQGDYGITVLAEADREQAPAIEGESLQGEPLSLEDFAGQTVVINVWGAWCSDCRIETPDLIAAERELRVDDVAFLGINIRDNRASALAYEDATGVPWPSVYDQDSITLLGFRGEMTAAATPTTYVIDEQGRVGARLLGRQTAETFVDVVDEVRSGG